MIKVMRSRKHSNISCFSFGYKHRGVHKQNKTKAAFNKQSKHIQKHRYTGSVIVKVNGSEIYLRIPQVFGMSTNRGLNRPTDVSFGSTYNAKSPVEEDRDNTKIIGKNYSSFFLRLKNTVCCKRLDGYKLDKDKSDRISKNRYRSRSNLFVYKSAGILVPVTANLVSFMHSKGLKDHYWLQRDSVGKTKRTRTGSLHDHCNRELKRNKWPSRFGTRMSKVGIYFSITW